MMKIANAQFWVHDQDEALAFYTKVLGWEVRSDVTMEAWSFRWLCVGPAGQDDVGLVLMPVPGPPMLDAVASAELAELVAKGAGGTLFSRPMTARPATTNCRHVALPSTTRRRPRPTASTRRSGIRRETTSDSPRCWSSTRPGPDHVGPDRILTVHSATRESPTAIRCS